MRQKSPKSKYQLKIFNLQSKPVVCTQLTTDQRSCSAYEHRTNKEASKKDWQKRTSMRQTVQIQWIDICMG